MSKIYSFFGGRKLFYFNMLFFCNLILLIVKRWDDGFGFFSIGLYATVVIGVEGNKYIRGKNGKTEE